MLTLNNGEILSIGGRDADRDGSKIPEIYNTQTGYRTLPGAEIDDLSYGEAGLRGTYYYMYAWQASDNDVWVIEAESEGGTSDIYRLDVTGLGSVEKVGKIPFETRNLSPGVMYDVDKVLITDEDGWIWSGDLSQEIPTWEKKIQMFHEDNPNEDIARTNGTFVPMPDGRVAIVGGSRSTGLLADSVAGGQNTILIWDPETNTYELTAPQKNLRMYHSVGLIMADGRIFTGGGAPGPYNHRNAEVFTPAYFYNDDGSLAQRPEITAAPKNITAGTFVVVNVDDASTLSYVTMMKSGAATHARNSDARVFKMNFEIIDNNTISIDMPTANILSPGLWMLSTVDQDRTPSASKLMGVNMVDIEDTDGIEGDVTVVYAIDDEQINGPFEITVDARFDDVTGRQNQRVFDFGNGANADNILLSQVGNTNNMVFAVYVGNQRYEIVANNVIEEDVISTWKVSVNGAGNMQLYKNDVLVAEGAGAVPNDVERTSRLIGQSNSAGSDQLQGLVRYLEVTNGSGGGTGSYNHMPMIDVDLSTLTGTVMKDASLPANSNQSYQASGFARFFDMNVEDTHTATVVAAEQGYVGTLTLGQPTTTTTTTSGQVGWTFSVPHTSLAGLSDDETLVQSYQLTITDLRGKTAETTVTMTITGTDSAPVVSMTSPAQNASFGVGNAITLSANATDNDGDITQVEFYAGATLLNTDTTAPFSYQWTNATVGSYNLTAKAYDAENNVVTSAPVNVTVTTSTPLTVDVNGNLPTELGSAVLFTANVQGDVGTTQYQWQFGDGTESAFRTNNTISHTYTEPGQYFVVVTARDATGREAVSVISQLAHTAKTASKPARSTSIVLDNANNRLWNVNPDNNTATVVDAASYAKLAEVAVGESPRSVAIAPNGDVWVVNAKSSTISVIDADSFTVSNTISLPEATKPFGLVFDANNAYITLEALGDVIKMNASTGAVLNNVNVGGSPRHIALTADGQKLYVSRFITAPVTGESTAAPNPSNNEGGEVLVINTSGLNVLSTVYLVADRLDDTEASARGIPNYLGAPVISPDGSNAWVPSKEDNIFRGTLRDGNNLDFEHTVRAISSNIDLNSDAENNAKRIDFDDASLASAATYGAYGNYLFVTLETSREVAVIDAYTGFEQFRFATQLAPQGITVSDDGLRLYVHNFMDRSVGVYDLTKLIQKGELAVEQVTSIKTVANETLTAEVLKGKQLFYDAADDRLAQDNYMSCASCHNDGDGDGRVWDLTGFGEGLRNTIELNGRAGMGHGFLHWSANFDEVQDFEDQIRQLAGGTGLMSDADFNAGTRNQPLGDAKAGVSTDLDALAAYVTSLDTFEPSPYRNQDGSLTAQATAGKTVFANNCASCHTGANFSKSGDASNLENIGTINALSGQRLGGALNGIDVPTLRDVWKTAPYLHNGSALTLQAAIAAHNNLNLNATDIANVVAYANQIGNETASNTAPTVAMIFPANNERLIAGVDVTLTAQASDIDGNIVSVSFYADGGFLIGTDTTAPYSVTVDGAGVPEGDFQITAVAIDNDGAETTSAISNITIRPPSASNTPPVVSLTSPSNNALLQAGVDVTLTATASDTDGSIISVSFYAGDYLIGTDTTAPYSIDVDGAGVPAGNFQLTAVATDNEGAVTTSTINNITIQ